MAGGFLKPREGDRATRRRCANPSLSQNMAAADLLPPGSPSSLPLPAQWATARAGPPGGCGRREGERGVLEGGRRAPLGSVPVDFMHPSLGPPIDRPRQGPSLKIHKGRAAQGGLQRVPWQLDLDFQPTCSRLGFCFCTPHAINFGSAWVRSKWI